MCRLAKFRVACGPKLADSNALLCLSLKETVIMGQELHQGSCLVLLEGSCVIQICVLVTCWRRYDTLAGLVSSKLKLSPSCISICFLQVSYSLTDLSKTQLNRDRKEIAPNDIPKMFQSSKTLVELVSSSMSPVMSVLCMSWYYHIRDDRLWILACETI